ncbi:MAG TPA: hypothetical protein VL117_07870, partial [Thermoleophilia bacterium]|nr:hypothetical protein [Thermoleophilia bacterium]
MGELLFVSCGLRIPCRRDRRAPEAKEHAEIAIGGGVVTIGALVGFFTVFGIAARNGILLINHCQHLEAVEGETFGPALVVRGA